jgi:hypothetical protein
MDKKDDESQENRYEGKLFSKRPVSPDAGTVKLTFRYAVTFGPAIVLGYWLWMQKLTISQILLASALAALMGAVAFGFDFFGWHVVGMGFWRRAVPDLRRTEYFAWAKRPDILGIRSSNGRRLILKKFFKVTALPTNLRGNFSMFVKQLASARASFSFQIVHAPAIVQEGVVESALPKGVRPRDWREFEVEKDAEWSIPRDHEEKWTTSVLFSTSVTARGYLHTKFGIRDLWKRVDANAASLEAAFVANYHHAKLEPVVGPDLAHAAQGLFPGPVAQSPKAFKTHLRPADLVKAGPAFLWLYLVWNLTITYLPEFLAWIIISSVAFFTIIGLIPALWPVASGAGDAVYYNPWGKQRFYCLRRYARTARGILCLREGTRRASTAGMAVFGHIALQGYADPTKWFRSVLASKVPILYQWEATPVSFESFRSIAKKDFASEHVAERAEEETVPDQETFLSYYGGFWLANGMIGTRYDYDLPDLLSPEIFIAPRKACTQQLRDLCSVTLNSFRDCGLVRLRAQLMRAGVSIMSAHAIHGWESGSGICQFLIAGSTFAPYVQLMPDLKRGLETCIPAEFNTPTNLDNYVILGNGLNTEILKEEGPAGLSEQCMASPVVVIGGSPHERAAVIQKVALELLSRGEGGIALDSTGAWTGLARATKLSGLWQKVTIQVAGQDFWADPFALAKVTPGFADALCDAFTLIFAWNDTQREFLYEAIYKVEEGSLELNAVVHALEMVLAERAKFSGDPVLSVMNTLVAGKNSLFFRSGAANFPAGTWARSNNLVILDFSPLPEPQQSVARIEVYLYFAFLAKTGNLSTRIYLDDAEQVVTAVKHMNLHLERFAQHFTLGNLPIVAGLGRPASTFPSFLELFDAAVCLQVRNKRDLHAIADIMAMDDKAEGGMYSEQRKSSYQIEFVQQLRPGWAVVKRSDRPEPFPIVLHLEEVARLPPVLPGDARVESAPVIASPGASDGTPAKGRTTTLIEHDLGPLAGLAAEVLDFLQAAASAQDLNGGPVSHKLLADQLLYKLQPAQFKFKMSQKAAMDVRNRLLDTLAAADYLRATYRKTPGGGETGATCYDITPKYLEAQEDALRNGSPTLKGKVAKQGGRLAGVSFTEPTPEAGPEPGAPMPQVTPGALDESFAKMLLPGLAAARVALLAGKLDDAAAKAELAWIRFLARALGRSPEDVVDFDVDSVVRMLATFPEWPFDPEESRVLWDAFKPGTWQALDVASLNQKISELTAFHEAYQLRGAGLGK